jgi:hypothetical protein
MDSARICGLRADLWSPCRVHKDRWGTVKYRSQVYKFSWVIGPGEGCKWSADFAVPSVQDVRSRGIAFLVSDIRISGVM